MLLDLLAGMSRAPADCVIEVEGSEASVLPLYPFLIEVRIECSRKEAWTATLQFESRRDERGKWTIQDAGVFAPWKEIRLAATFGGPPVEILKGYIQQVQASYPEDPGSCAVTVTCQDKSYALDRKHRRRNWGGDAPTSDVLILGEILDDHNIGLRPHEKNGPGQSALVVNQNLSDIRFLRSRAEANGYELIFQGDEVYFGPMRVEAETQPAILVYAGPATNCFRFDVEADSHRPDLVAFDVASEEGAENQPQEVAPDLALLGTEPADSSASGLTPFLWRMDRQGTANPEELLARARGLANENAMKVKAEGELDGTLYGHVLQVGLPVGVDGVGDWLGGVYYVDKVSHLFSIEGYKQTFTLLRNAYGDNLQPASSLLAGVL